MSCGTLSEKLADFTLNLKFEDIPPEVLEHFKLLIMDTLGVSIASYDLEHARIIRDVVFGLQTVPESTVWGTKVKVDMADAVLANAALIHGMDYDDTHVGGMVHPSASVVSTSFVVGEKTGASMREIMAATVIGWEIIVRLGLAARSAFHDHGYHPSGILAPFAATCTAGRLLNVSRDTLLNTLGLCGSQAASLQEFLHDGAWVKKMHPGWGAHSAIYSLLMAERGFTGPQKVFEGEFGLWRTHLGFVEGLFEAFSDLGKVWRTPEITFKLYQCCHFLQSFIECILKIKTQNNFSPDDIERIECRVGQRGKMIVCEPEEEKKRPTTEYGMSFSLPFIIAMTILEGKISPAEINVSQMKRPEVIALIDKVYYVVDESVPTPGHLSGWVKVYLQNGQEFTHYQKFERGSKENPININDVMEKFRQCAEIGLSKERTDELLIKINNFANLSGIDEIIYELTMD